MGYYDNRKKRRDLTETQSKRQEELDKERDSLIALKADVESRIRDIQELQKDDKRDRDVEESKNIANQIKFLYTVKELVSDADNKSKLTAIEQRLIVHDLIQQYEEKAKNEKLQFLSEKFEYALTIEKNLNQIERGKMEVQLLLMELKFQYKVMLADMEKYLNQISCLIQIADIKHDARLQIASNTINYKLEILGMVKQGVKETDEISKLEEWYERLQDVSDVEDILDTLEGTKEDDPSLIEAYNLLTEMEGKANYAKKELLNFLNEKYEQRHSIR